MTAGGAGEDAQLVEALSGKDRLYVLRIGEMMDVLVGDPRSVKPLHH